MHKIRKILLPVFLGIVFLSQGCASQDIPATPVEQEPTQIVPTPINDPEEIAKIVEQLELGEASDITEEGEQEEVEKEGDTPVEPSAQVDHCMSCHTDKEMLISTAKVEEEIVSENEGEG